MEAWFKGTNTDALQYIFDGYYSGGYKYNYIAVNASGKLQAVAAGMGTTETLYSTTTITDGAWHHHTLTCLMTLAVGDKVHCTTNNQDGGSTYRAWNGGTWDNFSGYLVS